MSDLSAEEVLTKQAYDENSEIWDEAHSNKNFWQEELASFQQLLPTGRILEVGCGAGRDATELARRGYDYLGTDISSGLLEVARRNNPSLEFKEESVYDLNYDHEFDGFWCSAVLLHIPREKIDDALQAIRRSVRDKAVGFISIKEGIGDDVEVMKDTPGNKRLFVYWQSEDFQNKLRENGFAVEQQNYKPMSERTKWLTYLVRAA